MNIKICFKNRLNLQFGIGFSLSIYYFLVFLIPNRFCKPVRINFTQISPQILSNHHRKCEENSYNHAVKAPHE